MWLQTMAALSYEIWTQKQTRFKTQSNAMERRYAKAKALSLTGAPISNDGEPTEANQTG